MFPQRTRKSFDYSNINQGGLISYGEYIDDIDVFCIGIGADVGPLYFKLHYCVNPTCDCTDARFDVYLDENNQQSSTVAIIEYNYKISQYSIEECTIEQKYIDKAMKMLLLQSDFNKELAFKYAILKQYANTESGALHSTGVKLGRNDFCPCGSGKKYKKCCLSTIS